MTTADDIIKALKFLEAETERLVSVIDSMEHRYVSAISLLDALHKEYWRNHGTPNEFIVTKSHAGNIPVYWQNVDDFLKEVKGDVQVH
jgi:hypothetical protein